MPRYCSTCGKEIVEGNSFCQNCGTGLEFFETKASYIQSNNPNHNVLTSDKAMKPLICEMCGGTNLVKQNGLFVCQNCGTKYSVEEARKMMIDGTVNVSGTINIDTTSKLANYTKLAQRAFNNKLYAEASKYYDKILEIEPDNWEAIFNKGMCAAWESTINNFRINESIKAAKNALYAYSFIKDININIPQIKIKFATDIYIVSSSLSIWSKKHYNEYWELEKSASEFWQRQLECIAAAEYAYDLLDGQIIQDNGAKNVKIQLAELLINLYVQVCEYRKYHSGYNNGNPVYTNIWIKVDRRKELVQQYDQKVTFIKWLFPNYNVPRIQRSEKTSACYIATSVYGSYDCPQVWTLRRYRDNILAKTWYGEVFIHTYYTISPSFVKWFGKTKWFNKMFKNRLDEVVKKLKSSGLDDTPYEDEN